jgi:hypothetical protein
MIKTRLKSKLFARLLGISVLIVFVYFILPAYRMFSNINDINNPKTGDIYIVNSTRLKQTEYYKWNNRNNQKLFETTFYRLLMIDKIENNNVYFKFSSCESNRLNNVKNWSLKKYKQENFFRSNEWITVPMDKLSSLNYRFMIVSIKKI